MNTLLNISVFKKETEIRKHSKPNTENLTYLKKLEKDRKLNPKKLELRNKEQNLIKINVLIQHPNLGV